MAAASIVTAASFAATTHLYYQNHRFLVAHSSAGFPLDPDYRLRMAGGAASVVGLLLAGVGFWIAASRTKPSNEPLDEADAPS